MTVRLGLALASGCAFAVVAYAVLRIGAALLTTEADPALVLYSEHAGFFWRALTSGYLGGSAAFVTWLLAGRDPARVAKALASLVPVAAAISAAQGLLVP